jgi:hypothetical protein
MFYYNNQIFVGFLSDKETLAKKWRKETYIHHFPSKKECGH